MRDFFFVSVCHPAQRILLTLRIYIFLYIRFFLEKTGEEEEEEEGEWGGEGMKGSLEKKKCKKHTKSP
jgi:hypothetical protein